MNILFKIKNYLNRQIFRTPGVEFFQKKKSKNEKKKYINFWLNRAKKNKSLYKYFFTKVSNKKNNYSFNMINYNFEITDEMFNSLSDNGLLIIQNALPKEERLNIIDHFNELKKNYEFKKNWLKKPYNPNFFNEVEEIMGQILIKDFKYLKKYSDQFSKEIYGKIVEPTVQFRYLNQKKNSKEKKVKGATYLHTDRFLPHFKVYYTPYEITIDDAPLEFVISSHKINDNFIEFYLNAKNFDETDEDFKKFKLKKKLVCVPENSLYVAFTNGFHRRVEFNSENERSLVFLQYVERFNKLDYLI